MAKEIIFGQEAREKVLAGVNTLANAVQATLGPRGRDVIIEIPYRPPIATKDGVTVAQWIALKDPFENLGAAMLKEAAARTAEVAGDGTTTATVLARSLFAEGFKLIAAGAAPIELKRGIDQGVEVCLKAMDDFAKPVKTDEDVCNVATISANGDEGIGKVIAEAAQKVGRDGVITIEDGQTTKMELEVVDGMELDQGFISPYFVTDSEKLEAVLDHPKGVFVLLVDREITTLREIVGLLNAASNSGRPLLIIAHDVTGEALQTLCVNRVKGTLVVAAVKATGFGEKRRDEMEDLVALTGATIIGGHGDDDDLDDSTQPTVLGVVRRAVARRRATTIIGMDDKERRKLIQERAKSLRRRIKSVKTEFEREELRVRAAQLSGGVAVIRVGAASQIELKERKDRVDDALSATQAAMESGIVPGGGVAYLRCLRALNKLNKTLKGDQLLGLQVLKYALTEPTRQIVENVGKGLHPEVVLHKIISSKSQTLGYDAAKDRFCDLMKDGIVDPLLVTRCALQHAASVATVMMTAEVALVEERLPMLQSGPGMPMAPGAVE